MKVYKVEYNDTVNGRYWYLKLDGSITDIPEDALTFGSLRDCECFIKTHGHDSRFHPQKMITNVPF